MNFEPTFSSAFGLGIKGSFFLDNTFLVSAPVGYGGTLPFPILKNASFFKAAFDITSRKITPTNTYYLDADYVGTETGSESQPYNDLKSAVDAANAAGDPCEFRVRGKFNRLRSFGASNRIVPSFNMLSWDGDKYLFSAEDADGQTYTKTSGQANVYQRSRSVTDFAIDYSSLDAKGFPVKYENLASIAEVDAQAGSIFISGSTVYIHALDSRDMTASDAGIHLVLKVNGLSFRPDASQQAYIEDLQVIGHQSGFIEINGAAANTGKVTYNRVQGKYGSVTNGFVMNDVPDIMSFDLYAGYAWRDGINYHDNDGIGMNVVEVDCESEYNGREGGDSQNGSSIHEDVNITRLSGAYHHNAGRNIHDIGTGVSMNCGVAAYASQAPTSAGSVNFCSGTGSDSPTMYLSECRGSDSIVNVKAATGSTIYIDNSLFNDATNVADGTITQTRIF
jgi:hypothetical protein